MYVSYLAFQRELHCIPGAGLIVGFLEIPLFSKNGDWNASTVY